MANDYGLASKGRLLWAPESTPYTAETTIDNYMGIVNENIDWPNPNEQKPLGSVGHARRPLVHTAEEREYVWPIPVLVMDARAPFESAIGQRKKDNLEMGHQVISNTEGTFAGTEAIADGNYHIDITVDAGGPYDVVTGALVGKTVTDLPALLQSSLRGLSGGTETVELIYGELKVQSGTSGAASTVSMVDSVGDGLVAALTAISGVTGNIDSAVDGVASAGYEYVFEDEDKLGTITIYRAQTDIGFTQTYAGCKASLGISFAVGEPLKATFDFTGLHHVLATGVSSYQSPSPVLPATEPFRFWNVSDAQLDVSGGGLFKDLVEITGCSLNWDNGLEIKHTRAHVRSSTYSREGYAVVEGVGADKYDMTLEVVIADYDLFKEAYDADELYDFYLKATRTESSDAETFEVWLYDCKIGSLPASMPNDGALEGTVTLYPADTKIRLVSATDITV